MIHKMATDDAYVQQVVYKLVYFSGTIGILWYFRRFLLHHTYKRIYAWILNGIARRVNRGMRREKRKIFQAVHKYQGKINNGLKVLDVGSGSAANIDFFPYNTRLVCLDPNPHFDSYIKRNLKKGETVVSAEIVQGYAEKMPFENESFDVIVCTLVLCTVDDPEKSIKEIHRVLKPGGLFVFLEHVAAEEQSFTRKFQRAVKPVHKFVADGCDPYRDTGKFIKQAGFSTLTMEQFAKRSLYAFWLKHWIAGTAKK